MQRESSGAAGPAEEPAAWDAWIASPAGQYVLGWEQAQFDHAVADLFGYHALQCGLPQLDALRANRMPNRVFARLPDAPVLQDRDVAAVVIQHYEELPFAAQSLDLVVLAHVLEFAIDPHQVLREVDRVLRPEGRVIVTGFNPVSLWGGRQILLRGLMPPFLPREGQFIGLPRLRDWFKLLGFEMDRGRYGCYRPPCRTQAWLDRTAFLEKAGDRWWPICGALYGVAAVKRVHGMRLLGPAWKHRSRAAVRVAAASPTFAPPAPGAPRRRDAA